MIRQSSASLCYILPEVHTVELDLANCLIRIVSRGLECLAAGSDSEHSTTGSQQITFVIAGRPGVKDNDPLNCFSFG
jgi:hypothetical protein